MMDTRPPCAHPIRWPLLARQPWRAWLGVALLALAGAGLGLPAQADPPDAGQPVQAKAPAVSPPAGADCPPAPAELTRDSVRQGQRQARDHGFLWKVQRDGRTHWLYGTLHVGQQAWMFPGPQTLAAIQASTDMALELDPMDPPMMQRWLQAMRPPAGEAALPAPLQARLTQQTVRLCAQTVVAPLRAELQAVTLGALVLRREGLDPTWAVDAYLAGLGHGLGQAVHSLETPEQQVSLLVAKEAAERYRLIDETLQELESGQGEATLRRLTAIWAEGRLEELSRYPEWCDCLNTPAQRELMHRMVDERNGRMADKIDRLARTKGRQVFVAVGSLHMVGPQGLPALLARRGYQVTPVPFAVPAVAAP